MDLNLIRDIDQLSAEIVQEDENGMDAEIQALSQIDAIPMAQKSSMSSTRHLYPTEMMDDTATPSVAHKASSGFIRGSEERSNKIYRTSSYIQQSMQGNTIETNENPTNR